MRAVKSSVLLGMFFLVVCSVANAGPSATVNSPSRPPPKQVMAQRGAQAPSAAQGITQPVTSPALIFLDVAYKIVICFVGIVGTATAFYVGIKYCRKLKKAIGSISTFVEQVTPDLAIYKKMAERTNAVIEKVLPDILRGFRDTGITKEETEKELTAILSREYIKTSSRKQLSDSGTFLLKDSQIEKFINQNLDSLIAALKKRNPQSGLDVENMSPLVLREKVEKDGSAFIHFKNYVFENPDKSLDKVFFVGSIYLCDKYLDKHPEVLAKKDDFGLP